MATKVAVLAHNQAITTRATTHVKREVAALLVARLCAEQITQRCIRMFPPGSFTLKALPVNRYPYIPEHMPPAEVGNCQFKLPESSDWKREHLPARTSLESAARREANAWAAESMPARFAKRRQTDPSVSESVKSFYDLPKIVAQLSLVRERPVHASRAE